MDGEILTVHQKSLILYYTRMVRLYRFIQKFKKILLSFNRNAQKACALLEYYILEGCTGSFDPSYFTHEVKYQPVANRYGYKVTKATTKKHYLENYPVYMQYKLFIVLSCNHICCLEVDISFSH